MLNQLVAFRRWLSTPSLRKKRPDRAHVAAFERLERRDLLSITAGNCSYTASSATQLEVAAPGVLANCSDSGGYQMTAHLLSSPTNGTLQLNADGGLTFNSNGWTGYTTATYDVTDTNGGQSGVATITFTVELGIVTAVDATKVAVDTIHLGQQILGDASGPSAMAQNLSLVYDSVAGNPDQVPEASVSATRPANFRASPTMPAACGRSATPAAI